MRPLYLLRHKHIYQAIKEENETYGYPICALCKLGNVSRAAYYKWLNREIPTNEIENDIVNIGLHFILKNVRPYAAPCSEA